MRTEEIYHRMQEVWIYDQLQPEEHLFLGRRPPRETPGWILKAPAREELPPEEIERREDEFLKQHGIK